MYCLINTNQFKPGKIDALTKALEREFVPIMKKSPGFRAAYAMAGPKGEYSAISLWDSRSHAETYAKSQAREKALAATADLFEGPMKSQFGEVIVSASS
jgi:heme-degrading monooxygenase HmoA